MGETVVTAPNRPKLVSGSSASLEPGVERYIVKGGGSAVFQMERDDQIDIALLEGGQLAEIVVFSAKGKSDLPALGLRGRGKPVGLQAILSGDGEDANALRFGPLPARLDSGEPVCAIVRT